MTDRRIGIDFDNTLVLYDQVFRRCGVRRGLLPDGFSGDKNAVRSAIRARPEGERQWTALQAEVYGARMEEAEMAAGAAAALASLKQAGARIFIVSHKTRFAAADPATDLRAAAWRWLDGSRLLDSDGGPIRREDVFFEETRAAKLARIGTTGCESFLDDLEEVFTEPGFPAAVARCLLVLDSGRNPDGPFQVMRSWADFAAVSAEASLPRPARHG